LRLSDYGIGAMNIRCPHCRNPFEVADETALADITCPTCGSSFHLVGRNSTTVAFIGHKRIATSS
jgi:DNA-directed RNA polymerase subunit RPC12/RpoP